jgi:benzoylformate decarboxylase
MNIQQFWGVAGTEGRPFPVSFDLSRPALRFADMAAALSVPSRRIETPDQIGPALAAAFSEPGPFLLDVVLEGDVHPGAITVHCGH